MRNYLKAELFRNFKRMYFWIAALSFICIGLLGCGVIAYSNYKFNQDIHANIVVGIATLCIPAYTFVLLLFTDMSIVEEIKNNTIKNIGSSGLSRTKMYVGKVIESILLMLIYTVIVAVVITVVSIIMLGMGDKVEFLDDLKECLLRGVAATFLWGGAITFSMLLAIIVKNSTASTLIYILIFMMLGNIMELLGGYINPIFEQIKEYLISTQLGILGTGGELIKDAIIKAGVIGIIYTLIFTVIGTIVINKKDI